MDKITIPGLIEKKRKNEKIVMLTAYDYPTAAILDRSGVDIILVGDSLGNVVLGYENTLPVTMDTMIHHTQAVAAAVENAVVIGDMPFMSYQQGIEDGMRNAGRFLKEAGAAGVKVEGNASLPVIKAMINAGIPVMGHLGFTPQSVNIFGGYKVQGRNWQRARDIVDAALALEDAGVFSIVLELIPAEVSAYISEKLYIPTIGIGAGVNCDGQVLVFHDMVGWGDFEPRHARRYTDLSQIIEMAVNAYSKDVKSGSFPGEENTFFMNSEEYDKFIENFNKESHDES